MRRTAIVHVPERQKDKGYLNTYLDAQSVIVHGFFQVGDEDGSDVTALIEDNEGKVCYVEPAWLQFIFPGGTDE